ncbi:hypothetical protein [Thiorhodococcus mannitoliphagus]|uniref:hypothetical protein n=1 Tax=Thiorhodococcus mannitoliphagus TaxID=329406 RepID=UPI00197CDACB|nr:hypothetical protein [Thiorhodococcus mannitoliphagus]
MKHGFRGNIGLESALFVDFDSVYSGLCKFDPSVADRFARTPQRWMNWLVDSLDLPQPAPDEARRRILVRRCYLQPSGLYQSFRPAFNLAGFEIIDCPSLTTRGSAPIFTWCQWVLLVPKHLRWYLEREPRAISAVLHILLRVI